MRQVTLKRRNTSVVNGTEQRIALGLRATPSQRAWLNHRAEAKGLSLQAYFDELMMREADSAWVPATETLRAVPVEAAAVVDGVCEIFRSDNSALKGLLIDHLRAFQSYLRGHG